MDNPQKHDAFLWHLSPAFLDPAFYATWPQALFFSGSPNLGGCWG